MSRADLGDRAELLSNHYRVCGASVAAIRDEMDALAYVAVRITGDVCSGSTRFATAAGEVCGVPPWQRF